MISWFCPPNGPIEKCPCCGNISIGELGSYEICEYCGWEDDPVQSADPDFWGGANDLSLNDYKKKILRDFDGEILPLSFFACRVCGLMQAAPPWGKDLKTPSFKFCDCCGVQFGTKDETPLWAKTQRQNWIAQGCQWRDPTKKPDDWDFEVQLEQVPEKFSEGIIFNKGGACMSEIVRNHWATAQCNNDFISLDSWSGYRGGIQWDFKSPQYLLPVDTDDTVLGAAVLDAMAYSRFVLPYMPRGVVLPDLVIDKDLYDSKLINQQYNDWLKNLMERYGYKTKKALFTGMKKCSVENKNGVINLVPLHQEQMNVWGHGDLTEADNVVIPDTSSAAEIGAALRLAFSRCTGSI